MSIDRDIRSNEIIVKKVKRETFETSSRACEIMGEKHKQLLGPSGTSTTINTITPCAACKLLRRRCAEECPFSPYFSPHDPHRFAAVHKVFGASNVSKMLTEVAESQRGDAANSLVYEANLRLRDPVYGCMGAISALQRQIEYLQMQLDAVRAEILKYKYREASTTTQILSSTTAASLVSSEIVSSNVAAATAPPPQPFSQPTSAPPLPLPHPSISVIISSSSSSSTPSIYKPQISATDYSSISSDNGPYLA